MLFDGLQTKKLSISGINVCAASQQKFLSIPVVSITCHRDQNNKSLDACKLFAKKLLTITTLVCINFILQTLKVWAKIHCTCLLLKTLIVWGFEWVSGVLFAVYWWFCIWLSTNQKWFWNLNDYNKTRLGSLFPMLGTWNC